MVFKLAQEKLEGEKYITGSLVVPTIEGIRNDLYMTRLSFHDSPKGLVVMDAVIAGFEMRFGDGKNVCEVDQEGPSRQPKGYTKVRTYTHTQIRTSTHTQITTHTTHF